MGTDVRTSVGLFQGRFGDFTPSEGVGRWRGFETPSEGERKMRESASPSEGGKGENVSVIAFFVYVPEY